MWVEVLKFRDAQEKAEDRVDATQKAKKQAEQRAFLNRQIETKAQQARAARLAVKREYACLPRLVDASVLHACWQLLVPLTRECSTAGGGVAVGCAAV